MNLKNMPRNLARPLFNLLSDGCSTGVSLAPYGVVQKVEQLDSVSDVFGWHLSDKQMNEIENIVATYVPVQVGKEFLTPPYRD